MRPLSIVRPVLVFGVLGGLLMMGLKAIEYHYLVMQYPVEIFGTMVAAVFVTLGVWLGFTITKKPETVVVKEFVGEPPAQFRRNDSAVERVGLTPRELQVLELIAAGLSNKEISERIHLSENTIKTHLSRVFEKLGARRRTQAVQAAKELGILP